MPTIAARRSTRANFMTEARSTVRRVGVRYNGGYGKRFRKRHHLAVRYRARLHRGRARSALRRVRAGVLAPLPRLPQPRKPASRGRYRNDPRACLWPIFGPTASRTTSPFPVASPSNSRRPAHLAAELKRNGYGIWCYTAICTMTWRDAQKQRGSNRHSAKRPDSQATRSPRHRRRLGRGRPA